MRRVVLGLLGLALITSCSGHSAAKAKPTPAPTTAAAADAVLATHAIDATRLPQVPDLSKFVADGTADTSLTTDSLDYCKKTWTHDVDRLAQLDHAFRDASMGQSLDETLIYYKPGTAKLALDEYRAALAACPSYQGQTATISLTSSNQTLPVLKKLPYLAFGETASFKAGSVFAETIIYLEGDLMVQEKAFGPSTHAAALVAAAAVDITRP